MNKKYTVEDIKKMSYTDFISLIREENRPSGGKKTIREIALNSFINENSNVLELGCTNGFSSIDTIATQTGIAQKNVNRFMGYQGIKVPEEQNENLASSGVVLN